MAITLGSLPLVSAGLNPRGCPQISLDICHPIQAVNTAAVRCTLPIAARSTTTPALADFGGIAQVVPLVLAHDDDAPDPPPPRLPA